MLSGDFLTSNPQSVENQNFVAVALTGTKEKFDTFLKILQNEMETYVSGIIGLFQFEDAGKAFEPVTPDCVHLMLGKQKGQRELFLVKLTNDKAMRDQYDGETFLLASNDVNTTLDGEPLTKSPLQKEAKLDIHEYNDLITASLKYAAMKNAGVKIGYTWKQMQSDWKLVRKCLENPWNERVFLPIDYKVIDAFDLENLTVEENIPSFEKKGPTIAIINRAYATLELDFRKGNELVKGIVASYQQKNWNKDGFDENRFPLGIQHKSLLTAFAQADQHVLISDHEVRDGLNLKEVDELSREQILSRIEEMLNGFSKSSVEMARAKYANAKDYEKDYLFIVTRKPGDDQVRREKLPRWKK